jgi:hypothetical protein
LKNLKEKWRKMPGRRLYQKSKKRENILLKREKSRRDRLTGMSGKIYSVRRENSRSSDAKIEKT